MQAAGFWVFRSTSSSGWNEWRAGEQVQPCLVTIVSPTWRAHLSCFISKGLKCLLFGAWGVGLPHMSSNTLDFIPGLITCRARHLGMLINFFVFWHSLTKFLLRSGWISLLSWISKVSRMSVRSILCPRHLSSLLSLEAGMLGHYHFVLT